ncbi:hypothetical protein Tfer_2233 [Thermincola ferriacetica]|uniref:Uncharacterized protein n=2 Tax=Thermincola ferriacetica TaxID=281456 RepID=A0A0L6W222_9FIRM|nr:hypothetical protein Tfer_2233 [Thermincola ferriacetica]
MLSFLTAEEKERLNQLVNEINRLENLAVERFRKHLEQNFDRELMNLAGGLPATKKKFCRALRDKLEALLRPYGKFAFAVWDWEWNEAKYADLVSGWENVYQFEVETDSDFHCTVFANAPRTEEWAQEVFDRFFSIKSIKQNIGLGLENEMAEKLIYIIARELIPVRYET